MRAAQRQFTEREDNFIRANYRAMSDRDIALALSRSEAGIKIHRRRIDCIRIGGQHRTIKWDQEKDAVILSRKFDRANDCARSLGVSAAAVMRRSRSLGVKWRKPAKTNRGGHKIIGYKDGKAVWEHRLIAAESLGRPLHDYELVHHIDCDKHNNSRDNLHVFTSQSDHRQAHCSIERLVSVLLERGIVRFDRADGVYRLCAIHN